MRSRLVEPLVEDPTRVFRAIRFETRLHFRLGEVTHKLIKDAVSKDLLGNIVGPRLFGELVQILNERPTSDRFAEKACSREWNW